MGVLLLNEFKGRLENTHYYDKFAYSGNYAFLITFNNLPPIAVLNSA